MPLRIEDYAVIGDCETAALVGRNGSIDWLCFPRFDSGACFAALLGTPENGRWCIAPSVPTRSVRRRYREETLILETEFVTDLGTVTVIDWMPPRSVSHAPDLMRLVRGGHGRVPMRMELVVRFDYGWVVPWVRRTARSLRMTAGPDSLRISTGVDLRGEDLRTVAEFTVAEGELLPFDMTWFPTYGAEPEPSDVIESLDKTEKFWRAWSRNCKYDGEWRDAVLRSLITLKALTYAPTGGLVAAATTSLPEKIGGVRNWDYRFCWIRDATFALYALVTGGYIEEARSWRRWLVNAVAGNPSELHIMYGLAGERRLPELELPWLAGYEKSAPVRVGNAAHRQFQLDVYGEILDVMYV